MKSITVKAPAKVNLFLKVIGKRKDSYHNIVTLFERISLADTIRISKIPKGIIVRSDRPITRDPKNNIVYKAAEAVLKRGKIMSGARVDIKKRIPVKSGLGGGSSDAASTIIGINRLFALKLSNEAMLAIGKRLGADVPFFLLETPFAIGRGRGDILEVVRSRSGFWHLIIIAGRKTSTKYIYREFDRMSKHLTPQEGSVKIQPLSKLKMDYARAESLLHNDLERAASLKKSAISSKLKSLAQLLGRKMMISGSGPSLFCLYRTRKEAVKARDTILNSISARSRTGWRIFVVETQVK